MNAYRVKRAKARTKLRSSRMGKSGRSAGVGLGEILVLLVVALVVLIAVNSPSFTHREIRSSELFRMYTPEQLQDDLAFLVDRLETLHPDLYAHVSNEEIHAEVQRIEGELVAPMNRIGFYRLVAPLLSRFRDPLTTIAIPYEERNDYLEQGALLLPLDLEVTEDQVTVSHNYSSDTLVAAGSNVLSINNTPIEQLRERLVQYISGTTDPYRYWRLGQHWRELEWLVYGFESPFEVVVRRPGIRGGPVARNLLGVQQAAIDEDRKNGLVVEETQDPWEYSFQRRESTGLVTVNELEDYPNLDASMDNLLAELESDGASALVLDLRGTTGSGYHAVQTILSRLSDRLIPVIMASEIRSTKTSRLWFARTLPLYERFYPPLFDKGLGKLWKTPIGSMMQLPDEVTLVPANRRYHGSVFVLVNGRSGPAASLLAGLIQSSKLGTVIGREEATAATGINGESFGFDLPNTRLWVKLPLAKQVMSAAMKSVIPDVIVEPTNYELRRGLDSVLVRALLMASRSTP
ncbi:MAG: S41 family peptidase [bacterium]